MNAKQTTGTVAVKLTAPATIAGIAFAAGATVALPPNTAKWLIAQGSAKLLKPGKETESENH